MKNLDAEFDSDKEVSDTDSPETLTSSGHDHFISSGCDAVDFLLSGGFERDSITTIYGPFSSGKTNICILAAINCVRSGKKVIYIDTETSFSIARLKQLDPDYLRTLDQIIFIKPTSFETQKSIFQRLRSIVNESIGLIVVDSIALFYRLKVGDKDDNIHDINRELRLQLFHLSDLARSRNIPVIITNQVYASFEEKDKIHMVGGDLLKYSSKCLIELQKLKGPLRRAILRKHRSLPEDKEVFFRIAEKGLFEEKID